VWTHVCWCLSQIIPRILHENDTNNQGMLNGWCHYAWFIDSQEGYFGLFKMNKRTNLDIEDAACLHIVHNMQHATSHPTTKLTQITMVNALKYNVSPLVGCRFSKSTKRSTHRGHQGKECKSGLLVERVWTLRALRSFRCKKTLAA